MNAVLMPGIAICAGRKGWTLHLGSSTTSIIWPCNPFSWLSTAKIWCWEGTEKVELHPQFSPNIPCLAFHSLWQLNHHNSLLQSLPSIVETDTAVHITILFSVPFTVQEFAWKVCHQSIPEDSRVSLYLRLQMHCFNPLGFLICEGLKCF